MNERPSYPAAEHTEDPKTFLGQIDEELRMYKGPNDLRINIRGLSNMYCGIPLMASLKKYSLLMNVANRDVYGEDNSRKLDINFFAGGVFATHVMLKPAPHNIRQRIMMRDPLKHLEGNTSEAEELESIVDKLVEWNSGRYQDLFQAQTDEFQNKVTRVAERMYGDHDQAGHLENDFISGFMFATNIIWQDTETTNPI